MSLAALTLIVMIIPMGVLTVQNQVRNWSKAYDENPITPPEIIEEGKCFHAECEYSETDSIRTCRMVKVACEQSSCISEGQTVGLNQTPAPCCEGLVLETSTATESSVLTTDTEKVAIGGSLKCIKPPSPCTPEGQTINLSSGAEKCCEGLVEDKSGITIFEKTLTSAFQVVGVQQGVGGKCIKPSATPMPNPSPIISPTSRTIDSQCTVTGCNNEVCTTKDGAALMGNTSCEWKPEYAQFRNMNCKYQSVGKCGWSSPTPSISPTSSPSSVACVKQGCNRELCVPDDGRTWTTTCEWKPEYAQYKNMECKRQTDNKCGWSSSTPSIVPTASPAPIKCVTAGCNGNLCVSEAASKDIITTCEINGGNTRPAGMACQQQANGACGWSRPISSMIPIPAPSPSPNLGCIPAGKTYGPRNSAGAFLCCLGSQPVRPSPCPPHTNGPLDGLTACEAQRMEISYTCVAGAPPLDCSSNKGCPGGYTGVAAEGATCICVPAPAACTKENQVVGDNQAPIPCCDGLVARSNGPRSITSMGSDGNTVTEMSTGTGYTCIKPVPSPTPSPTPTPRPSSLPVCLPIGCTGDGWACRLIGPMLCPTPTPTPSPAVCIKQGCNNELCVPDDGRTWTTTCEWKPEYAQYKSMECKRQTDNNCGWSTPIPSMTPTQSCIPVGSNVSKDSESLPCCAGSYKQALIDSSTSTTNYYCAPINTPIYTPSPTPTPRPSSPPICLPIGCTGDGWACRLIGPILCPPPTPAPSPSPSPTPYCVRAGTQGHLCVSNEEVNDLVSTPDNRDEYACYNNATCEMQPNQKCGWTTNNASTLACFSTYQSAVLWWYDDVHRTCDQRLFTGKYMYQSLKTFATYTACQTSLQAEPSPTPHPSTEPRTITSGIILGDGLSIGTVNKLYSDSLHIRYSVSPASYSPESMRDALSKIKADIILMTPLPPGIFLTCYHLTDYLPTNSNLMKDCHISGIPTSSGLFPLKVQLALTDTTTQTTKRSTSTFSITILDNIDPSPTATVSASPTATASASPTTVPTSTCVAEGQPIDLATTTHPSCCDGLVAITNDTTVTCEKALAEASSTPTPAPTNQPSSGSSTSSSSSSSSSSGSQQCQNQAPASAADLYQIDTTRSTATLYFAPANRPYTHYVIQYGEGSNMQHSVSFSADNVQGALKTEIGALKANTTYSFHILAFNGCASGSWSNQVKAITTSSGGRSNYKNMFVAAKTSISRVLGKITNTPSSQVTQLSPATRTSVSPTTTPTIKQNQSSATPSTVTDNTASTPRSIQSSITKSTLFEKVMGAIVGIFVKD